MRIEWSVKKNPVSPYSVQVPDTLKAVATIEKDTTRFPDTHGWAWGNFNFDAASDTFTPEGTDSNCGFARAIRPWRRKITSLRRIRSGNGSADGVNHDDPALQHVRCRYRVVTAGLFRTALHDAGAAVGSTR